MSFAQSDPDGSNTKVINGGTDGTAIGNESDRLKVAAALSLAPLTDIIYTLGDLVNGSTRNMNVNGSSTNVNYSYSPSYNSYLEAIILYFQDNGTTSPNKFGAGSELSNGIQLVVRSKGTDYVLATIKNNIDWVLYFSEQRTTLNASGFLETSDVYYGQLRFQNPIFLTASTDYVRAIVRDNLTGTDYLQMTAKVWRSI